VDTGSDRVAVIAFSVFAKKLTVYFSPSSSRNDSGQVVHTRVPLFTKQYKLVPAQAGR